MLKKIKTAVVGFGNILMGDEGIGVHVVQELQKNYSAHVKIDSNTTKHSIEFIDGGTAALDVLMSIGSVDKLIIIDTIKKGGRPGDIYRFHSKLVEKIFDRLEKNNTSLHDLGVIEALKIAEAIEQIPREIVFIGIEPKDIKPKMELSAAVKKEIPKIMKVILAELEVRYGSLSTEIH
ncbi:MAG: HyaD/HybD family hydrogenase maturation endopeptidase [Elusimicrobia bacterium]|nr:HyaD/HybD family hydrogenase maturation endopeptidase [Elusimicrobiota bacterium]